MKDRRAGAFWTVLLTIALSACNIRLCTGEEGYFPDKPRRGLIEKPLFIPPDLVVSDIMMGQVPVAVVNGNVVVEGDEIAGVTVFKIRDDEVEFSGQGQYFIKKKDKKGL